MMVRSILTLAGLALVLTGAAGCDTGRVYFMNMTEAGARAADSFSYESEDEPTLLVGTSGPVAVDVESFGGDVEIFVDPDLAQPEVSITRRAMHGFLRSDESQASLAQISSSVTVSPGALGQVLVVRTSTTHGEPHFQAADVEIHLPACENVRVVTHNGDVEIVDVSGTVDVTTDDGDIIVATNHALTQPVTIINNSGDVDYRIRSESTGDFDCRAYRGQVIPNFRRGEVRVLPGTQHDAFFGRLNRGENLVTIRAADGHVRIAVVEDPTLYGPFVGDN